jgi:hypothetical protein
MTQYLLAVHGDETAPPPSPEAMQEAFAAVDAFNAELEASGAWVFAGGLQPPGTATVVRADQGRWCSPTVRPCSPRSTSAGSGDRGRRPRAYAGVGGQGLRRVRPARRGAPVPGGTLGRGRGAGSSSPGTIAQCGRPGRTRGRGAVDGLGRIRLPRGRHNPGRLVVLTQPPAQEPTMRRVPLFLATCRRRHARRGRRRRRPTPDDSSSSIRRAIEVRHHEAERAKSRPRRSNRRPRPKAEPKAETEAEPKAEGRDRAPEAAANRTRPGPHTGPDVNDHGSTPGPTSTTTTGSLEAEDDHGHHSQSTVAGTPTTVEDDMAARTGARAQQCGRSRTAHHRWPTTAPAPDPDHAHDRGRQGLARQD